MSNNNVSRFLGSPVPVDGALESVVDFHIEMGLCALRPHLSSDLHQPFIEYASKKLHWESGAKRFYCKPKDINIVRSDLENMGISPCLTLQALFAANK